MEDREGKLTIEQLVNVGDHLHDADTVLLLIDKKINQKENETLCCVNGDPDSLITMISESLKKNDKLFEIFSYALLNASIKRMEKND